MRKPGLLEAAVVALPMALAGCNGNVVVDEIGGEIEDRICVTIESGNPNKDISIQPGQEGAVLFTARLNDDECPDPQEQIVSQVAIDFNKGNYKISLQSLDLQLTGLPDAVYNEPPQLDEDQSFPSASWHPYASIPKDGLVAVTASIPADFASQIPCGGSFAVGGHTRILIASGVGDYNPSQVEYSPEKIDEPVKEDVFFNLTVACP